MFGQNRYTSLESRGKTAGKIDFSRALRHSINRAKGVGTVEYRSRPRVEKSRLAYRMSMTHTRSGRKINDASYFGVRLPSRTRNGCIFQPDHEPRMWKSFSRIVYPRQILTANRSPRLAFMESGQFVQADKSIRIYSSFFQARNSLRLFNSPFGKTLLCMIIILAELRLYYILI